MKPGLSEVQSSEFKFPLFGNDPKESLFLSSIWSLEQLQMLIKLLNLIHGCLKVEYWFVKEWKSMELTHQLKAFFFA